MTLLEPVYSEASESFRQLFALWKLSRYSASNKELHPKFSGLIGNLYANTNSPQTVMTYLPPIQTSITNYETLKKLFLLSPELAIKASMEYVQVIMDVDSAIKAYHLV